MDSLCEVIGQVIYATNAILQDFLRKSNVKTTVDAEIDESCDNALSEKVVSLIAELSRISIKANQLRIEITSRENHAMLCLHNFRDLVQKQKIEIQRLSMRPNTKEMATDTLDLNSLGKQVYEEVIWPICTMYFCLTCLYMQELNRLHHHCSILDTDIKTTKLQAQSLEADNLKLQKQLDKCVLLMRAQQVRSRKHHPTIV
jgi:hypothetical protein